MAAAAVESVDDAIGSQYPGLPGEGHVRGAGPLCGGAPVAVGNPQGGRNGQGGALRVGIGVGLPQLGEGQGKDSPLQGAHRVVAVAGGVADFGRTDEGADVGVQHVFVGAVKPGIKATTRISIDIVSVPRLVVIYILADHQRPPSSVEAAFVTVFCYVELYRRPVFVYIYDISFCVFRQRCSKCDIIPSAAYQSPSFFDFISSTAH